MFWIWELKHIVTLTKKYFARLIWFCTIPTGCCTWISTKSASVLNLKVGQTQRHRQIPCSNNYIDWKLLQQFFIE